MAAVEKFSTTAICNILRHNNRQIANPSNQDIDPLQSRKNYSLLDQPESSYDMFLSRKKDLYCYNRKDVKVLIGWVITLPKNYPLKKQRDFFECVHQFLMERYGKENCVQFDCIIKHIIKGLTHPVFIMFTDDFLWQFYLKIDTFIFCLFLYLP